MIISESEYQKMQQLIDFLSKSHNKNEIPVACAIYDQSEDLLIQTLNLKEQNTDPTAHAEILAIKKVSEMFKNSNLEGCSIYITLEPCLMCSGAILESKISKLVFGAYQKDLKDISMVESLRTLNPKIEVVSGVFESECSQILSSWFKNQRQMDR